MAPSAENTELTKSAMNVSLKTPEADVAKVLAALALKAPKGLKYGAVTGALGASGGASLGEQSRILSGNSGLIPGGKVGAINSAIAGTLAGTAMEIMSDSEVRKTKEGKIAAALAAALSLALAWRNSTKVMTADNTIEKESSWRDAAYETGRQALESATQGARQGAAVGGSIGGIYGAGRAAFDPNQSMLDGFVQGAGHGVIRGGIGGGLVGGTRGLAQRAAGPLPDVVNHGFNRAIDIQGGIGGITAGLRTPHPMQQAWEDPSLQVPFVDRLGLRKQSNWRKTILEKY